MKNWLMFGVLGLIWGSSFLLIKIGVEELNAFELVTGRLGISALFFVFTLVALRKRIPTDRKTVLSLTLIGITNYALPFVLITWGEQRIDSGLAGVLNATTPLFSIVIAHLALADDKIRLGKILGLLAGFTGVVLLALRSVDPSHPNPIEGQIAILAAALSYAISAVIIRRNLRHLEPLVTAGTTNTIGAVVILILTLLVVHPLVTLSALSVRVTLAVLILAFVNTFIAYIIYYALIADWGASRATMVTYVVPPISLLLGVLLNGEHFDIFLLAGAVLIVGGVVLANLPRWPFAAVPATPLP
ncbi:MAG: EamA family transporter [Chloroflexota bacterium]